MSAYQAYMSMMLEKQALNALTKRLEWGMTPLRGFSPTADHEFQHIAQLNGHEVGRIDIERYGPTSSAAYVETTDAFPNGPKSVNLQGLGLGRKLFGRAARHEHVQGRTNLGGDPRATYTADGEHLLAPLQRRGYAFEDAPAPLAPGKQTASLDLKKHFNT